MNKEVKKYLAKYNQLFLGWFAIISGIVLWLSPSGPSGLADYLSSHSIPLALLLAWIIIISFIFSGIAILRNWKPRITAILPAIILIASAFTKQLGILPAMLLYLLIAADYITISILNKK